MPWTEVVGWEGSGESCPGPHREGGSALSSLADTPPACSGPSPSPLTRPLGYNPEAAGGWAGTEHPAEAWPGAGLSCQGLSQMTAGMLSRSGGASPTEQTLQSWSRQMPGDRGVYLHLRRQS